MSTQKLIQSQSGPNARNGLGVEQVKQTALQEPQKEDVPKLSFSPRFVPQSDSNTQRSMMKSNSALEVIKVSSTYEYYYYLKHKQEYQKKQEELINLLNSDGLPSEHISRITFSIKQVGISNNNDGKFGIQSQRKFIQRSQQKVSQKDLPQVADVPQNVRINYKFNSKRFNICTIPKPEKIGVPGLMNNIIPIQFDDPTKGNKTNHYHNVKMIKRINQRCQMVNTNEMVNTDSLWALDKFNTVHSYSRLLSSLSKRGQKLKSSFSIQSESSKNAQFKISDSKPMPQLFNKLESHYSS